MLYINIYFLETYSWRKSGMHDIFCKNYDIHSLTKVLTCYENPGKSSYIDLSLTNRSKRFQGSSAEETGLPDFQ